jgi:general secretion pathway protein G
MYRMQRKAGARSGFTLIELLVVMAIIAVLAALTSAAVMNVWASMTRTQTKTEINDLDNALKNCMVDFKDGGLIFIPSQMVLRRDPTTYNMANPVERRSAEVLMKMFGKKLFLTPKNIAWNGQAGAQNAVYVLQGPECLVFFAGGIPDTSAGVPNMRGFGADDDPSAQVANGLKKRGPYFNFQSKRLVLTKNPNAPGFYEYQDPYLRGLGPTYQTYAFFSSNGVENGYSAADAGVDQVPTAPTLKQAYIQKNSTPAVYYNPKSFQIVSAGPDGDFGNGAPVPGLANPLIQPLARPQEDNQTNFTAGPLSTASSN